jgi:ACS family tartrate transporter-like MFS transporter
MTTVIATIPDSNAVGRSALRKANLRILPLLGLGYGAAILDRNNIGFASLQMNHDLHFSATMYGFGAGLFFLGYAACEIPSNLLLYRFGARRWIARILFTWGLLAMGMMLVRTPIQFYCMRFLLGMAEAGFFPGAVFYLMHWFPNYMRARAISRFYIAASLAGVVNGLLAGPLLSLQGKLGLAGWQWLFLVEGLLPAVLGVLYLVYLPDHPGEAKWLTTEERNWLIHSIDQEMAGVISHGGVMKALRDPRIWQFGLVSFCMMACIYTYLFSAPAVLQQSTAWSVSKIAVIMACISVLCAIALVSNAKHSDQSGERYWHMATPMLLMAVGFALSGLLSGAAVAPALAVGAVCFYATQGIFFAMPATFMKGKAAAVGIAAINSISMLGGFVGPLWMGLMKDRTGSYRIGLITLAIPSLIGAAMTLFLRSRTLEERRSP